MALFSRGLGPAVFSGVALLFAQSSVAAESPSVVNIYTHGEGEYGMLQPNGSLSGKGVDQISCALKLMEQPFNMAIASMARSNQLEEDGLLDIWFPTYESANPELSARLSGRLGEMSIYWFVPKTARLKPDMKEFKSRARVTAFPASRPERYLKEQGFNFVEGSDDENRLVLWLLEGKIDAVLAADFRETLKPGSQKLADELEMTLYRSLGARFELSAAFVAKYPTFKPAFDKALDRCTDY